MLFGFMRACDDVRLSEYVKSFPIAWGRFLYNSEMQLPVPSSDALLVSRALESLIQEEIRASEHWISFARFMELALYTKDLGYYSGVATKLGKGGDFTTAPEMTTLFGATLASFASSLSLPKPLRVLEFGAGSGKLAEDFLHAARDLGLEIAEYSILELSSDLRERQQQRLAGERQITWLDTPPSAFTGLILCNEVLDAMPVPLMVRKSNQWWERGVSIDGDQFVFADRSVDQAMCAHIPDTADLPDGYLTEIHPRQEGFVRLLGDMLQAGESGLAVLIDYGFPAREYYLPQRSGGTLMCHYRHHAHDDPFLHVGLQDITAHVDFTGLARTGLEHGLEVAGYMSQAAFLLSAGLPQWLEKSRPEEAALWLPLANAVQKLTSPAEMGELFKVLLLSSRVGLSESLINSDQSYRL
jgi:SAM-dependent MidA family methyltransferase